MDIFSVVEMADGLVDTNVFIHALATDAHSDECRRFLIIILSWPGIEAEKVLLVDTVNRWKGTGRLGFVDAYLIECASRQDLRVFTKNVRELREQGADVPDPLPGSPA